MVYQTDLRSLHIQASRIANDSGIDIHELYVEYSHLDARFNIYFKHKSGYVGVIRDCFIYSILEKFELYCNPWLQYKEDA